MRKFLDKYILRRTSTGFFIPEVDGIRFLAIIPVVLFHFAGMYGKSFPDLKSSPFALSLLEFLGKGDSGVKLFFTLSGFILGRLFIRHLQQRGTVVEFGHYVKRRLLRLEPTYILNLVGVFLLLVVVNHSSPRDLLSHLIASIFYVHNQVYGEMSQINYVTWSLEVEIQFYLTAPLFAMAYMIQDINKRTALLAVGAIGSFLLTLAYPPDVMRIQLSILSYLHLFLTGMLLADWHSRLNPEAPRKLLNDLVGLVGLACVFGCHNNHYSEWSTMLVIWFGCILVIVSAFTGRYMGLLLRTPLVYAIGGMCYTIYLWHSQILSFIIKLMHSVHHTSGNLWFLIDAVIGTVLVIVLSTLLYVLFERPFMDPNWPRRLGFKKRTA